MVEASLLALPSCDGANSLWITMSRDQGRRGSTVSTANPLNTSHITVITHTLSLFLSHLQSTCEQAQPRRPSRLGKLGAAIKASPKVMRKAISSASKKLRVCNPTLLHTATATSAHLVEWP